VFQGETDLTMSPYTTGIPAAKSGKARGFGVTLAKRSEQLPGVPAIDEVVPGYVGDAWHGLFAPAGTPRPIVDKLAAAVKEMLGNPENAKKLSDIGAVPSPMTPEQFAAFIDGERKKWSEVVKAAGVKID
jgi:tripartite-type tricarboxylate transporter receptor subunit TctC